MFINICNNNNKTVCQCFWKIQDISYGKQILYIFILKNEYSRIVATCASLNAYQKQRHICLHLVWWFQYSHRKIKDRSVFKGLCVLERTMPLSLSTNDNNCNEHPAKPKKSQFQCWIVTHFNTRQGNETH